MWLVFISVRKQRRLKLKTGEIVMNIVITGSKGKMGLALLACARKSADITVVGEIDVGDDIRKVLDSCDVVLDFSHHTATASLAAACAAYNKPLVIGTTGHSQSELDAIVGGNTSMIPIVKATNFSVGMNTLFWLTRKAAEILGPGFDLEVVEMHHRLKKDAPSGSATTLGEILAEVRGQQLKDVVRNGRAGMVGARTNAEIGMHSLRGGDVVGDHTVVFASVGERVELTHKASSRDTFANGALRAARWVTGKPPGLYNMQDVLGLSEPKPVVPLFGRTNSPNGEDGEFRIAPA